MNDPNAVCVVFAACLDRMIGGNVYDDAWEEIVAALIYSGPRGIRIWKSI